MICYINARQCVRPLPRVRTGLALTGTGLCRGRWQVEQVCEQSVAADGTPCVRTQTGWLSERERSGAVNIEYIAAELWQQKHWQNDAEATHCNGCLAEFGVFLRRHHCRSCGDIYCYSCALRCAAELRCHPEPYC
jgi:hypothetical protein